MLGGKVSWPGLVSMDPDGTVKFKLKKIEKGNWSEIAKEADDIPDDVKYWNVSIRFRKDTWPVKVEKTTILNPTVCEIILRYEDKIFNLIHPGRYVSIFLRRQGM